jgi:RNA polymerase sigma-70 factor (ECF subfamily)
MTNSPQRPGDEFSEKYQMYGKMLYRLAIVLLGNKEDAEEAMQEAFIKLLNKSPVFEDIEQEKRWLVRITTNICKDMFRSVWRKRVVKMDDIDFLYDKPDDVDLLESILRLPQKYKIVILLYYFENYSVKEIARIIRANESAVKMRLHRGRNLLKIELEGDINEDQ